MRPEQQLTSEAARVLLSRRLQRLSDDALAELATGRKVKSEEVSTDQLRAIIDGVEPGRVRLQE